MELPWVVVIALIGIIIGGAGGATLVRGAVKKIGIDPPDSETNVYAISAKAAAEAANAASQIAITLREMVGNHLTSLERILQKQGDKLDGMATEQTRLVSAVEQFPRECELRHKAVDENQKRIQVELNALRK